MPDRAELKSGSKGEETRQRILNAALALFHERGLENATMREIAEKAGVATGAAYYYFSSKDAIVLAFYERAAQETALQIDQVLEKTTDLRKRIAGVLEVKLGYFAPSRRLLTALAAHVDPAHPLSPFSEATRDIREEDIERFRRAVSGSRTRIPKDLEGPLPRLLWMYQMALILYWIHDRSPGQQKTAELIDGTLRLVARLIQLSSLPLLRPFRRQVLDLCRAAWE
ncbi:MAG TPA: TetR family transcriptional regulator [Bryobacteraceae bacterium]|nr:TetR family transcriptional regulator [Bryobacteraceae bacterium]